jgi:hypothetical protein
MADPGSSPSPPPPPVTDSAWFWLSIFLCGALVVLMITAPRWQARQHQLERQFQGRQHAGQTVVATPSAASETRAPPNGSAPLVWLFVFLLITATVSYWSWRWHGRLSKRRMTEDKNA